MRGKPFLRVAVVVAAAAAAAAAVCLLPQVQTWAGRRLLATLAPQGSTLECVSAGPRTVTVQGLRIPVRGGMLYAPRVEARLGVFTALFRKGYLVSHLVAVGWVLDLTQPQAAAPAPDPAVTGGVRSANALAAVLGALSVPEELSVDAVDLEGSIVVPDAEGRAIGKGRAVVLGGGLGAGRTGRFTLDIDATLDDPASAPVSSASAHATLAATMDPAGTFAQAELDLEATARGRQVPEGIVLSGRGLAARQAGRTTYSFALIRAGTPIATLDASSADGSMRLAGAWRLDLRDSDVAPFALGRRLPTFHLLGTGTHELDAASGSARAEGKLEASADQLGILSRALAGTGALAASADFDVTRTGDSLRVDRLDTTLSGTGEVASVRALQPFEFNEASGELKVARPSGDLVGISVKALPLAWLKGPLPALEISGGDATGEFALRADNGRLALRTNAPLSAAGVSASWSGRPLASAVEASAFVMVDYSLEGWQAQVAPLTLKKDGLTLLTVDGRVGRLAGSREPLKVAGSWSASLPGLLREPAFRGFPSATSGDTSGSFEASLGGTRSLGLKLAVESLGIEGYEGPVVRRLGADIRVDVGPDGAWAFRSPVTLAFVARQSTVELSGQVSWPSGRPVVQATLASEDVGSDEGVVVAALLARRTGQPDSPMPAAGAPPPWPDLEGKLSFSVGLLRLPGADLRSARGQLSVESGHLRLEGASFTLPDGSALRLSAMLSREEGPAPAYSLDARFDVAGLSSSRVLALFNPDRDPIVDGIFDASGAVHSRGTGLDGLLGSVQGDCRLSSKGGRVRALRTDILEDLQRGQGRWASAVDKVEGLFGKKAERLREALTQAAAGIGDIHYDQMNLTVTRAQNLDVALREISIISPELRASGEGLIAHAPGIPIGRQPFSADLNLSARGSLGRMAGLVGLTGEGRDDLGYSPLYETVHLSGTLHDVDTSQLKDLLVQAPLRKGGGIIDKLLGR